MGGAAGAAAIPPLQGLQHLVANKPFARLHVREQHPNKKEFGKCYVSLWNTSVVNLRLNRYFREDFQRARFAYRKVKENMKRFDDENCRT